MFVGLGMSVLTITLAFLWSILWYHIEYFDVIPLLKGDRILKNGEVVIKTPSLHDNYRILSSKDGKRWYIEKFDTEVEDWQNLYYYVNSYKEAISRVKADIKADFS